VASLDLFSYFDDLRKMRVLRCACVAPALRWRMLYGIGFARRLKNS